MRSILALPEARGRLGPAARKRFDSIFSCSLGEGRMVVPESMRPWATRQFGSITKLERQPILRVTNDVLYEGALFNKLRADRPMHGGAELSSEDLVAMAGKEPFADVEANTPEDTFGRLYGRSEVSASNVAKYDALHGLIIFNRADPLAFTEAEVVDHYNAALSWIAAARAEHPEATQPLIGWNCLWKAAASLVHGHLQVLVSEGPYAAQRLWTDRAAAYKRRHGRDFWTDWHTVHASLGLGAMRDGVAVFASITPRKEKEVVLLAGQADERLFRMTYRVLDAYRELGVQSFNVVTAFLPGRVVTRIVDRGRLDTKSADIGITELYCGQSVVAADPVKVWRAVRKSLARR